ncbi:5541_t:CDS:2 [Racocetra fulgida]|uniref:5541_t:CDS:1 n=1 Tax=Racocetra fulgida TaxID=60492 RepID=A0A9N8WL65_9GLOM|nr:5541_t:CDS:2 [Racocetra fulgida]
MEKLDRLQETLLIRNLIIQYLEVIGANIKVGNKYIVSENIKFSDSGKIMVEAIDIDYVKNDVDSTSPQKKKPKFSASSKEDDNITAPVACEMIKTSDIEKEQGSSFKSKKSPNHIDLETIDDYQEAYASIIL